MPDLLAPSMKFNARPRRVRRFRRAAAHRAALLWWAAKARQRSCNSTPGGLANAARNASHAAGALGQAPKPDHQQGAINADKQAGQLAHHIKDVAALAEPPAALEFADIGALRRHERAMP